MLLKPTYAEDGLISQHVCDFLNDSKFLEAYNWARAGVPWSHPGEIRFRANVACWAASHATAIEGDFVECGVSYGVLSSTICRYIGFENLKKRFYLYDTFGGIPIETLTDKTEIATAKKLNATQYQGDAFEFLQDRFFSFPNVELIKGVLPGKLIDTAPKKISYLSIDLNNAGSEIGTIELLWPRLSFGGVVLLDDYAYGPEFSKQRDAWNRWSQSNRAPILTMPTGQGVIIKSTDSLAE